MITVFPSASPESTVPATGGAAAAATICQQVDPVDPRTAEIEQAQRVLRATRDGDDLAESDLMLLQAVVNYGRAALRESSRARWDTVLAQVERGQYAHPWLHGVEHLTKDQLGFVRWRGIGVEHFSFVENEEGEREAAHRLGQCCRFLEAAGRPVSSAEVLRAFDEARFGQGMDLGRWLVMWVTQRRASRIVILPIESVAEAHAREEIARIVDRQMANWSCSREELRHMTVVSLEDFDNTARQLTQSCDWAMRALDWREYSNGRRAAHFLDTLHGEIQRDQLPPASAISETIFTGAALPHHRDRQREAGG